jgi:tetratricopeptide (TPR) repeat protein
LGEQNAAREELQRAGAGFEQEHNLAGAGRAYLELATSYLASGQGQQVLEWANKAVTVLGSPPNPALHASVHHLLAAGGSLAGRPLAEGEAHLLEAIQLATANNLPELAGAGRFELGNLQAQRGDLQQAIESFATALATAQAGNDLFRRVLAHNNLAYHAMLAGQLTLAEENIETALALAEKHALFAPRQYLYSTRGEIALVQGAVDQAKQWFEQALIEASRNNNHLQAANIRANLGLAARERGDLDEALLLLEEARAAAGRLTGPHLQIQIDLWLAELFLQREEQTAARQALERAQIRLMGGERRGLQAWANRLKARLDVPLKGIDE